MNIKKAKHTLIKIIITLAIIEGIYLYALPFSLNLIAKTDCIKNIVSSKTNANFNYEKIIFKTHIYTEPWMDLESVIESDVRQRKTNIVY